MQTVFSALEIAVIRVKDNHGVWEAAMVFNTSNMCI